MSIFIYLNMLCIGETCTVVLSVFDAGSGGAFWCVSFFN